jgi:hypothetical protein
MTPRVHKEWHNRIISEYSSAAVTARLLHQMIVLGMEDKLIDSCMRIIRDELDHARLSYECLCSLGGSSDPIKLKQSIIPQTINSASPLIILLDDLLFSFLLGESFAVPLFNAMYAQTTHPQARQMLERVLQDEAFHRAFGWMVLDSLLEHNIEGVREHIASSLPKALLEFKNGYAPEFDLPPLQPLERSMGLLDLDQYKTIWYQTYREDISNRFKKRGFETPSIS